MNTLRKVVGTVALAAFLVLHVGCSGGSGSSADGTSTTGGDTTGTTTVAASAGSDQSVVVGATVALDGSASTGATTQVWSITSKPATSTASLTDSTVLTASFVADVEGTYEILLSVNDGASTDSVTITATAVDTQLVSVPDGSAVTTRERFGATEYVLDADATSAILSADTSTLALVTRATVVSYDWEQVAGPAITATSSDNTSSTFEFTAPSILGMQSTADHYKWQPLPISRDDTTIVIKLTVTDDVGTATSSAFEIYLTDGGDEIHPTSGLNNVALGNRLYLSGPSSTVSDAATISNWTWTLSAIPTGSVAVFEDTGTTTSSLQVPVFTPDVAGVYTVRYSSTTPGFAANQSMDISAGKYVGVGTVGGTTPVAPQCANCHDGTVEPDKLTGYLTTKHSTVFEDNMAEYALENPTPALWQYNTTGYNTDDAANGFDDVALADSFVFPAAGLTFTDFVAANPNEAKYANVQCESCHGPGSLHNGNPLDIAFSTSQYGVCGQCHQQEAEWKEGAHSKVVAADITAWKGTGCERCHTGNGFQQLTEELNAGADELEAIEAAVAVDDTLDPGAFIGQQCAACHDPHEATNPKQLRRYGEVEMIIDGSTVDAGPAAVCYTCHDGYYNYGHTECDKDDNGTSESQCLTEDDLATYYTRQVHYNAQAAVFEGKGILTDINFDGTADFTLTENSFHTSENFTLAGVTGDDSLSATNDKCVTCHMSTPPSATENGYRELGGHNFRMVKDGDTTSTVKQVSVCKNCHLDVTDTFDRSARADYDGDGTREGIQTEIKGLLVLLSDKLKAYDTVDVTQTSASGATYDSTTGLYTIKALSYASTAFSQAGTKGWYHIQTQLGSAAEKYKLRRAIFNFNFIAKGDQSWGVHNAAYIVQALQKTYSYMGGSTSTMTLR